MNYIGSHRNLWKFLAYNVTHKFVVSKVWNDDTLWLEGNAASVWQQKQHSVMLSVVFGARLKLQKELKVLSRFSNNMFWNNLNYNEKIMSS